MSVFDLLLWVYKSLYEQSYDADHTEEKIADNAQSK